MDVLLSVIRMTDLQSRITPPTHPLSFEATVKLLI